MFTRTYISSSLLVIGFQSNIALLLNGLFDINHTVHCGGHSYFLAYVVPHTSASNTSQSFTDKIFLSRQVVSFVRGTRKSNIGSDNCSYNSGSHRILPAKISCAPTSLFFLFRSRLKTFIQAYQP